MSEDPPVTDLVTRAAAGDKQAWDALVDRYAPLVWSICRRHRLSDADVGDISRTVWGQLAAQLGGIRDPAADPGWLAGGLTNWPGRCGAGAGVHKRLCGTTGITGTAAR